MNKRNSGKKSPWQLIVLAVSVLIIGVLQVGWAWYQTEHFEEEKRVNKVKQPLEATESKAKPSIPVEETQKMEQSEVKYTAMPNTKPLGLSEGKTVKKSDQRAVLPMYEGGRKEWISFGMWRDQIDKKAQPMTAKKILSEEGVPCTGQSVAWEGSTGSVCQGVLPELVSGRSVVFIIKRLLSSEVLHLCATMGLGLIPELRIVLP